ncbi:MAG: helix-turn-helix domain-containing protein [Clostridia bacterium]|nr:helix-turn-helix domain-containing protein [Clostridia bacterium]
MDQIKIGKFIAECRKKKKLTQMQLAEMLNITDRAISKWECGKAMPDSSIMLELCGILDITVNDLLSGEVVPMDNYNKEMENKLIELVKEKEHADKRLLAVEVFIGITATVVLFTLIFIAAFVKMAVWLRVVLIVFGFVLFLAGCFCALRIEQVAGYYKCKHCGHRYVPTYKDVTMAQHMGRTRYMRCPSCGKKSWQKKVISKDEE